MFIKTHPLSPIELHHKETFIKKLMNINEEIPTEFYVFVNLFNPITKHNFEFTKGFTSGAIGEVAASSHLREKYINGNLDYIPFIPSKSTDIHGVSMYSMNALSSYRIEYNCEQYRRSKEFSKVFPSRMSCLYAFGDYDSCKAVSDKYGWDIDSVKKFKLIPTPLNKVVKVNMEVISLFRGMESISIWDTSEQEVIWEHYWSGKANLKADSHPMVQGPQPENSGVIWEYLIEGRIELIE